MILSELPDRSNDPEESHEDNFQALKAKSLAGIGSLIKRQVATKVIYLVATVILARLLTPQSFGIYAIIAFMVQFFSTFGDVGLGAALIQKKGTLSREELATTFWLQQALVWTVALLVFALAPLAKLIYPQLPANAIWMLRVMVIAFVIASLKTIPAILLERDIRFDRIAQVDVVESLSFYGFAVIFAWLGLDVWSFIYAALARSILSVITVYLISPWRPERAFRFSCISELVRFGVPYQGNNVLAFIKDAVTPLFVGTYAGPAAVGYVNWARNFAFAPLMISEAFGRVAFPAFSRIQDNKELLGRTIERSIRMMTLIMFPVTALVVALAPELTHLVYTDKWLPGIPTFYYYCTSPAGIGVFLPLYIGILSLGNARIILLLVSGLVVFEWGIGVPCVMYFGFVGVAMTQPITVSIFTFLYKAILAKNGVRVNLTRNILPQLFAAVLAGIAIKLLAMKLVVNFVILGALLLAGGFAYLLMLLAVKKDRVDEFVEYAKSIAGIGAKK